MIIEWEEKFIRDTCELFAICLFIKRHILCSVLGDMCFLLI